MPQATNDVVDAIYDKSKFLPLNDGNALDHLMGQNYNNLQSDLKNIKENDPLYKIIPKEERTTESGKRRKIDLVKLLVKFDAIIKHHVAVAESRQHSAGGDEAGLSLFFIHTLATYRTSNLCLPLNPLSDENELEISGNSGEEGNVNMDYNDNQESAEDEDLIIDEDADDGIYFDEADDAASQHSEYDEDLIIDEGADDGAYFDEAYDAESQYSEYDEDLIIDENADDGAYFDEAYDAESQYSEYDEDEEELSEYLQRTSMLQRIYHEMEPNIIRLRFDIYVPGRGHGNNANRFWPQLQHDWSNDWHNPNDSVEQFINELNGHTGIGSYLSYRRVHDFEEFWSRNFGATLLYSYPPNEQDVIQDAQQMLSNTTIYLFVMKSFANAYYLFLVDHV